MELNNKQQDEIKNSLCESLSKKKRNHQLSECKFYIKEEENKLYKLICEAHIANSALVKTQDYKKLFLQIHECYCMIDALKQKRKELRKAVI